MIIVIEFVDVRDNPEEPGPHVVRYDFMLCRRPFTDGLIPGEFVIDWQWFEFGLFGPVLVVLVLDRLIVVVEGIVQRDSRNVNQIVFNGSIRLEDGCLYIQRLIAGIAVRMSR